MDPKELADLLRTRLGWRVGPHTARYVAARLDAARGPKSIPVLVADARTGLPLSQTLRPDDVRDQAQGQLF